MRSLLIATALLFAPFAAAQCGTLAVSGTGAAGTSLTVSLTGATANSFAILLVAENTGTTVVQLPMGANLTLGLAQPILPLPLARTDANGDASRTINIPTRATTAHAVNGQVATFSLSLRPFALTACASNVAGFTIGG